MSLTHMAAAWQSSLPPTDRLVLLALADWADKAGRCWPSVPQLAVKTGIHERTVRLAILRLESGGYLQRRSIIGKGTRYRLNAQAEPTPGVAPTPGVTPTPGVEPTPGVTPGTPGVTPTNTPVKHQERKKTTSSPSTRTPDQLLPVPEETPRPANPYPMPDSVDPQAWSDFLAARKRKRLPNTASAHKTLMDDLARHATDAWPVARLIAYAAGKGWASVRNPEGDSRDGRLTDRTSGAAPSLRGSRPDPSLDLRRIALAEIEAEERAAAGQAADSGPWVALPSVGSK